MLKQEGAAFFRVTGVAGFSHRVLLERFRTGRPMCIVTIRAGHLSFEGRVMRHLATICALFFVTGEAHFGLRQFVAHLVVLSVNLVTGRAGDILIGMLAGFPMGSLTALVASQTSLITFQRGRVRVLAEDTVGLGLIAAASERPVFVTFTVTICTGGRMSITSYTMRRLANGQYRRMQLEHGRFGFVGFVVTARALGITLEHQILGRFFVRWGLRSEGNA